MTRIPVFTIVSATLSCAYINVRVECIRECVLFTGYSAYDTWLDRVLDIAVDCSKCKTIERRVASACSEFHIEFI